MKNSEIYRINSVSEMHNFLKLPKPEHPLISIIDFSEACFDIPVGTQTIIYDFYTIYLKKNFDGKIRYGQKYYDFNNGIMSFFGPKQAFAVEGESSTKSEGWMIVVHPDFLKGYSLSKKVREYGFFSYDVNEALHCSEKEEKVISGIVQNLQDEMEKSIDYYTQDLFISHLTLLLDYCNRFYNRQFITRKIANHEILASLENLLKAYFDSGEAELKGIPTVQYVAEQLNVSQGYLGDMLRSFTGQNSQQHIHNAMIEKAKELLSSTTLTVAEIAYFIGFERPQSFNKLFKSKTQFSPLKFRQSFN